MASDSFHLSVAGYIYIYIFQYLSRELPYIHAGIFMALQEKVISCGASLAVIGMILRFIAGPAAMAIGSIAVGLQGNVLRVAIIQVK